MPVAAVALLWPSSTFNLLFNQKQRKQTWLTSITQQVTHKKKWTCVEQKQEPVPFFCASEPTHDAGIMGGKSFAFRMHHAPLQAPPTTKRQKHAFLTGFGRRHAAKICKWPLASFFQTRAAKTHKPALSAWNLNDFLVDPLHKSLFVAGC